MIRHIANLWTLSDTPGSWDEKCAAIKAAGFDGIASAPVPDAVQAARKQGLMFVGYIASGQAAEFGKLIRENKEAGARHINVQLANEDTLTPEAVGLAILLIQEGRRQGVDPAIEVHRDTCTETPEKAYALADAYQKVIGELLPMTWDFSHIAVVKHLAPGDFVSKMIIRPDLIQRAQQFHFRPFNGHHCQVPVTDGQGRLTQEVKNYLPFVEAVLKCWLSGNPDPNRELFACPEMGPAVGPGHGYNLSTLPNSWEDAKVLRAEIDRIWKGLTG